VSGAPATLVYEFGSFRLDPANQTLLRDGTPVQLTPKVFSTLVLLVEHRGRLVEKDEFMRRVWPGTFVEDAALAESISRLRRALGEPDGQALIVTVPKRGYRFVAEVRTIPALEPPGAGDSLETAPNGAGAFRLQGLAIALGLTILALGALSLYVMRRGVVTGAPPMRPIHSLAVLPLENLSRDPEYEYFADEMTDELITQLAKIRSLRVISRASAMRLKGTRLSLAEIAKELNVEAVVEGSVARSAERVRVTAQVIQVQPESHLWAESYERPLGDIVTLQGALAREISQAIRVTLTPQDRTRLASVRGVNQEAYEAFLKGRYYWNRRTEDTTRKALTYFQTAVSKDPGYALAFTGIADSYISLALSEALQEAMSPREALPRAREAVSRALALDEAVAEAHATLGMIQFNFDRDWAGAETSFKRSIELNPNYANAHHWYAMSLVWQARLDEALREIERARELDPLSLVINANAGFVLAIAGRAGEAAEQCRRTLEMDPNFAQAWFRLGQIDVSRGMYEAAIEELEKAIQLSGGSPRARAELGLAQALAGKRKAAETTLAELERQAARRYVSPFDFALVHAGLGNGGRALEWLEKAYDERSPGLSLLQRDPAFLALRQEPRFRDLVRRIGLPQ
jgi:TolB-like protein/DNA-binding winged helix-turn-helix (wHTH) protein/Tfp pilus assembly protein PilF